MPASLPYWRRFGLDDMTSQLRSWHTETPSTGGLQIITRTYLSPPILAWGYDVETTYTISSSGTLSINVKLKPTGAHPQTVPRIGLDLHLTNALVDVTWLGPGPGQSYPDSRSSQKVGIWKKTVAELQTVYDVPQENGNRMDTRWLELAQGGAGLKIIGGEAGKFHWGAGGHTAKSLEDAKHPCDLVEEDATLLKLNAEVAGTGTAACGPGVREEFEVKCREMEFEFLLQPLGL
jgi:beta-galactosidase